MNFGGNVPLTSYKHVAVAIQELVNDHGKTFLPLAHCGGRGCILSGLEYTPNKNNKTIWVLRYDGHHAEELRNYAANIAEIWAISGKLQFSKCRMLRALLPCFGKQADRETGIKYIRPMMTSSQLPRYDIEKYIGWYRMEIKAENELQAIEKAIEGFGNAEFLDKKLVDTYHESIEICNIEEV